MLNELIENEGGVYLLYLVLAVGVGLMSDASSRRTWIGSLLVTAVFTVLALTVFSNAYLAVPIYVLVFAVAALLSETRRLASTPLLVDEPYWKKIVLTATHPRTIRNAARVDRRDERRLDNGARIELLGDGASP